MMRRNLACLVFAVCALGCAPSTTESIAACEEATYAWHDRAAEVRDSFSHACTVDDDCVLASTELDCAEGAYIGSCDVAVSAENLAAFNAELASAAAEHCATVDPDCMSAPSCVPSRAVCRSGVCDIERGGP